VLIDGGKGHLGAARLELEALGLKDMEIASIAKEHNLLYTTRRTFPIRLSPGSRLLLLIQRRRDEAHRFAITYHRRLRTKEGFRTPLRDIKGVGPSKEKILIEKFGSVAAVRDASREELLSAGVDKRTARAVVEHFRKGL
jgi:excinuclease ABC subunit C